MLSQKPGETRGTLDPKLVLPKTVGPQATPPPMEQLLLSAIILTLSTVPGMALRDEKENEWMNE